jgi:hypothetical protein
MSILDKLKDLVAAMEDAADKEVEETQVISSEPEAASPEPPELNQEDYLEEDSEIPEVEVDSSYLECSAEESRILFEKFERVNKSKTAIADLLLSYESRKRQLLQEISESTRDFYQELDSLRLEYGIPGEGYSVQLPTSESEKVIFTKD